MRYLWPFAFVTVILGCNEVVPGTCRPNTTGGAGGADSMAVGAGVGVAAAAGTYGADPQKEPLAAGDGDSACSDPCEECSTAAGGDQRALLQQYLENDQGAGGLTCSTPDDCVDKCVAEAKLCVAPHAVHPYKPPMMGDLYQCIDSFPSAKNGGSYTCLYRYSNGDACIFSYGSKLGPLTLPAPRPLCVYKSP
jgi:hypothetical protein